MARSPATCTQGATMMLTDLPAHPDTRSATDFVIMRDHAGV
jgi:hypothetical protein